MIAQCEFCQRPLIASKTLLEDEDEVVEFCRPCGVARIQGPHNDWHRAGPGLLDRLRAEVVKGEKERNVLKEMLESPITDPRWNQIQ